MDSLDELVAECAARWELTVGDPFAYAHTSFVSAATSASGEPLVLKVQYPDRESEHEAAALARWDGEGAVRLVASDPERHALLLERCEPGADLSALAPDAALEVMVELVGKLGVDAEGGFVSLESEAALWSSALPESYRRAGAPFEESLLVEALSHLEHLATSQGRQVLLHQDLHAGNVLASRRAPWLVIDPKPLSGELEFAVAPIVRGPELGHSRDLVNRRLERLVAGLGLDADRARGWVIAQSLAWSFEGTSVLSRHVDVARWLVEGRRRSRKGSGKSGATQALRREL